MTCRDRMSVFNPLLAILLTILFGLVMKAISMPSGLHYIYNAVYIYFETTLASLFIKYTIKTFKMYNIFRGCRNINGIAIDSA